MNLIVKRRLLIRHAGRHIWPSHCLPTTSSHCVKPLSDAVSMHPTIAPPPTSAHEYHFLRYIWRVISLACIVLYCIVSGNCAAAEDVSLSGQPAAAPGYQAAATDASSSGLPATARGPPAAINNAS